MAEKYSKATQVGATGTGKGGRIYDTQKKATVTYKGSAKDLKFSAQQAANPEKADKQRAQALERQFLTERGELKRRQDAETIELKAQQKLMKVLPNSNHKSKLMIWSVSSSGKNPP